jgi:nucleoside-diphosphate-sugar epimerase
MNKILIMGGTDFISSHVKKYLEYEIYNLDA